MSSVSTELRVFISSTFRDLQEEREYLVKKIFPEIRALCRERGIAFTEVDLRWGLTEEDQVLGQVLRTCLEEIDRCRPWFIGITGERYGHVPEFHEVQKDPELLRLHPWIEDAVLDGASIIEMEFRHAVLNRPAEATRASFFFRRHRRSLDVDHGNTAEAQKLEGLKGRVREAGLPVQEFRDPVSLGELVYDELVDIIGRDFTDARPPTPIEEERARHESFAASRRHAYIANAAYIRKLNEFAEGDEQALVVYAESGSGKSALLAYWAEGYRRRHPEAFVVEHYVGIGAGKTDHLEVIRHIMLEVNEYTGLDRLLPNTPAAIEQEFPLWLADVQKEPLVLIVDGLNQLQGVPLALGWLPKHIPPKIRLIISSTVEQTLVAVRERGWKQLGIQPLLEKEREAVVVRFLSEYHKALSSEQVRRIAADVKCAQPLFLRTLLEELRLFGRHERLEGEITRYLETTGPEDLFQVVCERLEEDFGAKVMREVMSLLWASRGGLSEPEIVEITGISRLKLSSLVMALDYHLLRSSGRLTFFHDFLRRAVEKRYLPDTTRRKLAHREIATYIERITRPDADSGHPPPLIMTELPWQLCEAEEFDRLKLVITRLDVLELFAGKSLYYELLGYWLLCGGVAAMELSYSQALKDETERPGCTDERESMLLESVAELYRHGGIPRSALPLTRRRTEIREATCGTGHPDTAQSLNDLACLLFEVGEPAEAELLDRRALAIRKAVLGADHPGTAQSLDNLAVLLAEVGNYAEAEPLHRRALEIRESTLGTDHPDTVMTLNNLAVLLLDTGAYPEAEVLFRRVLAVRERTLGVEHPRTARSLNNLANLLYIVGAYSESEPLHRRGLAIREALLGPDHPDVAQSLGNLAALLSKTGNHAEAESLQRRGLAICENVYGLDHPEVVRVLNNLGDLMLSGHNHAEAELFFGRALAIAEARPGTENLLTAESLHGLGRIRLEQKELTEAAHYLERGHAICRMKFGDDHLRTLAFLFDIGRVRWASGRSDEGRDILEQVVACYEHRYGSEHPESIEVRRQLDALR